jgi:putative MATE family efflux protein
MYNICRGIMNAVGDSKRPLYYLIFSSVLNIILDLVFVGLFKWGVWSAALATVISQMASVVLCMIYLCKKGNVFSVELSKLRLHGDMFKEIIRYGLPSGVQNSVIAFANVIVQTQINSFGKLATAAYGTHAKIEGFAFLPMMSFNMATSTFISQNLGAKLYDRAKKGARFGILSAVILAELIGIVIYFTAPHLIAMFDDNPEVIALGVRQARTASLFYFLLAFSHAVAAVCRGAGKAFVPMFVMLSIWCGLRITYIAIVTYLFNNIGLIYWAYPLTWAISSVIYLIYYLFSDWIHGFENQKAPKKA